MTASARPDYPSVICDSRKTILVTLVAEDGRRFEWSPAKQSKVEVYAREVREVAVGDELRFTKSDRVRGVNNGTLAKVTSMDSSEVVLSTKTGELRLNAEQLAHGALGLCLCDDLASHTDSRKTAVELISTRQDKTSAIKALEGWGPTPGAKSSAQVDAVIRGAEIE